MNGVNSPLICGSNKQNLFIMIIITIITIFKDQTASKEFRKCFSTTVSYLQFLVSLVYCKSWNFIHIHTELLNRKTKYIPSHFARL